MTVEEMETIQLDVHEADLNTAQHEARREACAGESDRRLIAWYDRTRETGGPEPACQGEPPKCVRDYAASHGAECRVWVNDGEYEFYFAETGQDVAQLDPNWVVHVHEQADTMEHANVQGG